MEKVKNYIYSIYYYATLFNKYNYHSYKKEKEIKDRYLDDIYYLKYIDRSFNLHIDIIKDYFLKNYYDLTKIKVEYIFFDTNNNLHNLVLCFIKTLIKDINPKLDFNIIPEKILFINIYNENNIIEKSTSIYLGHISNYILSSYIDFYDKIFDEDKIDNKYINSGTLYKICKDNEKLLTNNKNYTFS